ncbi:MAG: hypothetical protein AVDCRST_MAG54-1583, partial [uncultured Actinomycetospora sp.]
GPATRVAVVAGAVRPRAHG